LSATVTTTGTKSNRLFPFGYGLSYTTFKYENLRIKKTGPAACEVVFDVKNTGPVAGAETAQIYVGPRHPPVPRPVRELKGFAKVQLAPGETKTVTIPLGDRAFEFFDPKKNQWTLAPGTFDVFIGASSRDLRCGLSPAARENSSPPVHCGMEPGKTQAGKGCNPPDQTRRMAESRASSSLTLQPDRTICLIEI
jgi:beta-glucosidase